MKKGEDSGDEKFKEWQEHEERERLRAQREEELNPSRKPLHNLFRFLNLMTICVALAMGLCQAAGIFLEDLGSIDCILRIYVMVFCSLVIVNETDLFSLTKDSKILRIWITRGVFYNFIGVLGLSETAAHGIDSHHRDPALDFIYIFSWAMVMLGFLYFTLGVACMQLVYNRLEENYRTRVERAKELKNNADTYGSLTQNVV